MTLGPYGAILRRPGVGALVLQSFIARIPIAAAPLVLTLHVVQTMGRGYAESGLLAAAYATGAAIGAPLLGRAIDRVGLRPVLIVTTAAETMFWLASSHLGYGTLLVLALFGGLLAIPAFSVARQALASMLPPEQRQAGQALDSISVEMSFAIGPALGIVLLTQAGSTATLTLVGVLIAFAGISLLVLNPPMTNVEEHAAESGPPVPTRVWLRREAVALLLITGASAFTLAGTDTAIVAVLRSFGETPLIGLVITVWCLASMAGGFVYGTGRRVSPLLLLFLLAVLCIPAAAATTWWLVALLLIPTGAFCAPVVSATAQDLIDLAPARSRGQVTGLHVSALTIGGAIGAPIVGVVVDTVDPRLGFVAIGVCGVALCGAIALSGRRATIAPPPIAPRGTAPGVCLPASK